MPNTGFGRTLDIHYTLQQELTAVQRTLRKCSTRFLVVTPLQTGKQINTAHARVDYH
jgi:hypothetical protein